MPVKINNLRKSEHEIQSEFFALLALNENRFPDLKWFHAIPNASGVGGSHGAYLGARFKREGRKAGVYDCFLPLPAKGFHGFYIEFKTTGNKESAAQTEFGLYAREKGFYATVCYSADEALRAVEIYTGWKLTR